jgi:hypothetical protein
LCAIAIAALFAVASPSAHHSYSAYQMDQLMQIDGELEAFEWISPHSLLKVRTAERMYTIEWRAPNALQRSGLSKDALKAGDHLIVTGNPRRDVAESGVINLRTIRRMADGWVWDPWKNQTAPPGSNR